MFNRTFEGNPRKKILNMRQVENREFIVSLKASVRGVHESFPDLGKYLQPNLLLFY